MKSLLKYIVLVIVLIPLLLFLGAEIMVRSLELEAPIVEELNVSKQDVTVNAQTRILRNSWYRQNSKGLWEAYIEGSAYERGKIFGVLAEEQVISQEEAFVSQIRKLVPSEWFLKTLKYGVVFFNRNLPDHVPLEYQQEIYGVSESFADEYDFIGEKYSRILNYHAAHDIGHALQDLSIVGCSSFAVWNQYSQDSSLIVARNFDFYMGDDFAKDKILLLVKPDSGYAFASITWAGFMGVVSGMNSEGLTVTLNASKSEIPDGAKTPISILAREILQYASSIDEARAIAEERQTFVSESILIGSAKDRAAAVIEKSPDRMDVYHPSGSKLICTNHYQSKEFANDPVNVENIQNSDSDYRYRRLAQLVELDSAIGPITSASILRNQKGIDEANLGLGNPKAINQLLAHHGVVFEPEKRLMWVSTNPFQLGEFLCYDLNQMFSQSNEGKALLYVDSLSIGEDPFLNSNSYDDFLKYKELKNRLFEHIALGKEIEWNHALEAEFIASNTESYITYFMLGDYHFEAGNKDKAAEYYEMSLSKEVASEDERRKIESNLSKCH